MSEEKERSRKTEQNERLDVRSVSQAQAYDGGRETPRSQGNRKADSSNPRVQHYRSGGGRSRGGGRFNASGGKPKHGFDQKDTKEQDDFAWHYEDDFRNSAKKNSSDIHHQKRGTRRGQMQARNSYTRPENNQKSHFKYDENDLNKTGGEFHNGEEYTRLFMASKPNHKTSTGKVINGRYVSSKSLDEHADLKVEHRDKNSHRNDNDRHGTGYFKKNPNFSFQSRPSLRPAKKNLPIDSEQARMLTDQLIEESYECMVCCDRIRPSQPLWSCQNCYHLFHLKCIKQWAGSEAASIKGENNGWRCPACQNVTDRMPFKYTCFCGKVTNPDWNPRDGVTPHSCGELCWKTRKNPPCSHTCNELCHPGPCPSCPVMVLKECFCGKTSTKVRCGHTKTMKCNNTCNKLLGCKKHYCSLLCHEGPCEECSVVDVQNCYCGKETRDRKCGEGLASATLDANGLQRYSCDQTCSKTLDCENHACNEKCHGGNCASCPNLPKNIKYCPCKQTLISDLLPAGQDRQSCLDPIPCCNSFCGKKLPCGAKGQSHWCKGTCHTGECGPCEGITVISCRCGNSEMELPCKEFNPDKEFKCERRCNKKRNCGRHRCNQKCCVDLNHHCNLICGRKLSCGLHKCDEVCHSGSCPRCWQTSFEERFCYCGNTVQYPPIPCGTPLPECSSTCTRPHPCRHEPKHYCHNEDACPPCVVLVEKPCLCNRETRKNVPCHINKVSCGKPCQKKLKCRQHKCPKICHKGECLAEHENCLQPCVISRRDCPHPCGAPCHVGQECPEGLCKSQITIKCKCGRKSEKVLCLAGNSRVQFQRFATDSVGDKLRNLRSGRSVDISGLMIAEKRGGLDCDEDCAVMERNKNLAEALGIENPEGNHFTSMPFSYFLKEEAKKQLPLVKIIEEAIETLIQKIKKSSILQLSHSFQPMNSTQRKLVHELAEHYNCKTVSYDQEPKRNTIVTATRDSCLVVPKLSTILERKNKPLPQPVLNLQEKPLNFQRMAKKNSQDDLRGGKASSVDYFGDDFPE